MYLFLIYVLSALPVRVCAWLSWGPEEMSDPLELEVQTAVRRYVSTGN